MFFMPLSRVTKWAFNERRAMTTDNEIGERLPWVEEREFTPDPRCRRKASGGHDRHWYRAGKPGTLENSVQNDTSEPAAAVQSGAARSNYEETDSTRNICHEAIPDASSLKTRQVCKNATVLPVGKQAAAVDSVERLPHLDPEQRHPRGSWSLPAKNAASGSSVMAATRAPQPGC
jgi:hypothetical protein